MGMSAPVPPDFLDRITQVRNDFKAEVRFFDTHDLTAAYVVSHWWGGQEMVNWRRGVISEELAARREGREYQPTGPLPDSLLRMRRLQQLDREGLLGTMPMSEAIRRDVEGHALPLDTETRAKADRTVREAIAQANKRPAPPPPKTVWERLRKPEV
jgi:hypothetical protein